MRLIDADALVTMPWVLPNRMTRDVALECFRNIVKEQPTIDVEPMVHCRECKNSEPCPVAGVDYIYCNEWERISGKNGYCHCGAKMDAKEA